MGDNLGPNGLSSGCKVFCSRSKLLQIEVSKIIVHEACEPNAVVDFFDSEALACEHGRDVDPLAVQADATAGSDQDVAVVKGVAELR